MYERKQMKSFRKRMQAQRKRMWAEEARKIVDGHGMVFDNQHEQSAYEEYMGSDAWQLKREQAFQVYGRSCMRCTASIRLCVHHKTYERLGKEQISDLCILCRQCHKKLHELFNVYRRTEGLVGWKPLLAFSDRFLAMSA